MNDDLSERLLRSVMGWSDDLIEPRLRIITSMAQYKYDSYQGFHPGRKFVESLAMWLSRFQIDEREAALSFLLENLIFLSDAEMRHLVELAHQQIVRPIIRDEVADHLGLPRYWTKRIENSQSFAEEMRRCLFLGMSDGARLDEFRRSSGLSNEQFHLTYEIESERCSSLQRKLAAALGKAGSGEQFRHVFLIDDFAGSGTTLLREEGGRFDGRLHRFAGSLRNDRALRDLIHPEFRLHVCLYVMTNQARGHLESLAARYTTAAWTSPPLFHPVAVIPDSCVMDPDGASEFGAMLNKYYNPDVLIDEHKLKGGDSVKFGFANCGISLVFDHNCPNNSLYLIWADIEPYKAVFPRIERHRSEAVWGS